MPAEAGIHCWKNMNLYYVYILANRYCGTLYTGVTGDLIKQIYQHRESMVDGFSTRYRTHLLVWFEIHNDIREAIRREKQIRRWKRAWKIRLIEESNPQWEDLWCQITGQCKD